ncbi:MAG: aminopeptidase P N-terminal domain-containing protein [Gemmatimonadaceae bacterium]
MAPRWVVLVSVIYGDTFGSSRIGCVMHRAQTRLRIAIILSAFPALATSQDIAINEYAARRRALMERVPDGIGLIHAASGKRQSEPSFVQAATFFYFTGDFGNPAAILAIDGVAKQAHLFVPPPPTTFGFSVEGVVAEMGAQSAARRSLASIEPWDSLLPFLRRRLGEGVTTLYVDEARWSEALGVPAGLDPIGGSQELWRRSLTRAFPTTPVKSIAAAIRELRFVKSSAEIAILRDNARTTAKALRSALGAVRPGGRQRMAEMRVATACVEAGAVGPSFWPWMMSGPNAHVKVLVRSDFSYTQLDRVMQSGELVRVDIGCAKHGYGADVGRTVPVSGRFTAGQAETWNLLIAAYRVGVAKMKGGIARTDVLAASRAEIARLQASLTTEQGRRAAQRLLALDGMADWSIHSVGVDSGESALPILAAGAVVAFEPIFSVDEDAFYLEDMILITETGYEVLSAGLPYTAREIEAAMAASRGSRAGKAAAPGDDAR